MFCIVRVFLIILAVIGVIFLIMALIAIIKKPSYVYKNKPEEKNPMEGKMVKFVPVVTEPANADVVHGHLEAVGVSEHNAGIYEKVFKRILDIILRFGGLVLLSPVFLFLSIWILINDPGPILFTQKRIGRNKQYFKLHKFRSMKMSTPHDKPTHMLENPDQYITKSGRFIRLHSLEARVKIRQTTGTLVNKGFCEVSPIHYYAGRDLDFGHRELTLMNDEVTLSA